jgi:hypothetical protein
VLLDSFDVAFHHAIQLQEQEHGLHLAHSQALEKPPYQMRLKVMALVTM